MEMVKIHQLKNLLYGRIDLMTDVGKIPSFLQNVEFLNFININKVPLFEVSLQHITKLNTITSVAANINDNVSFLLQLTAVQMVAPLKEVGYQILVYGLGLDIDLTFSFISNT